MPPRTPPPPELTAAPVAAPPWWWRAWYLQEGRIPSRFTPWVVADVNSAGFRRRRRRRLLATLALFVPLEGALGLVYLVVTASPLVLGAIVGLGSALAGSGATLVLREDRVQRRALKRQGVWRPDLAGPAETSRLLAEPADDSWYRGW